MSDYSFLHLFGASLVVETLRAQFFDPFKIVSEIQGNILKSVTGGQEINPMNMIFAAMKEQINNPDKLQSAIQTGQTD